MWELTWGVLSWRPRKGTTAENMEVKVIDRLAAVFAAVCDDSISVLKIQQFRNFVDFHQQVAGNVPIRLSECGNVLDFLLRYQQHVNRRLRLNVMECDTKIVFVNDVGRNFFVNNFLEDGLCHNCFPVLNRVVKNDRFVRDELHDFCENRVSEAFVRIDQSGFKLI